jgi:phosphoribosylformimino-5-aminoimidazole carboxamide ribotide isomerase
MRVLPVIDLQRGVAVHGRAGQRERYRPVESVLSASADPVELARGFQRQLELETVYVADLDGLSGEAVQWPVLEGIAELGMRGWLDAGVRDAASAARIAARLPTDWELIVGLESLASAAELAAIGTHWPLERLVVSLDLKSGRIWSRCESWQESEPLEVACELLALGVRRMILLDVSRVGMEVGTGTAELVRAIRHAQQNLVTGGERVELWSGGGVRGREELQALARDTCDGVLLATAVHAGRITVEDLRAIGAVPRRDGSA